MNFKPPMHEIGVKFTKVVRVTSGNASIIENTYIVEISVEKSSKDEIYTTNDGRFFIRLLASNRKLSGHNLVEYVKAKCLINKEKAQKNS